MKKALIAVGVIALIAIAFFGGTKYASLQPLSAAGGQGAQGTFMAGAPGADGQMPQGGPMANLSEAERAKLQDMTEEERQAFFKEKFGSAMPAGGPGGAGGPGRGGAGIEGTVVSVSDDQVTVKIASGGSQNFYVTDKTVVATAKDSNADGLEKDADVLVFAQPSADGVTDATAIIVK
jgi:hypothetical protein